MDADLFTAGRVWKTEPVLVGETAGTVCVLKREAAFSFRSSNDIQMMLWKKSVLGIR